MQDSSQWQSSERVTESRKQAGQVMDSQVVEVKPQSQQQKQTIKPVVGEGKPQSTVRPPSYNGVVVHRQNSRICIAVDQLDTLCTCIAKDHIH